jgi:hypothetical protein
LKGVFSRRKDSPPVVASGDLKLVDPIRFQSSEENVLGSRLDRDFPHLGDQFFTTGAELHPVTANSP